MEALQRAVAAQQANGTPVSVQFPVPAPVLPHPSLTPANNFPIPNIYAATASGRGRPPMGGMRRNRPAFNLQDITTTPSAPPAPPTDDAVTPANTSADVESKDDDNPENATPSSASQTQSPSLINQARLGAGRPSSKGGPQAASSSQPQRKLPDLGSPFANFSRIVYVSSPFFDPLLIPLSPRSDPSGTLNFNGKAILHAEGVNFSSGAKFSISMDQLKLDEELGKGNYGTVKKVLHRPTNVYMAMKVCVLPSLPPSCPTCPRVHCPPSSSTLGNSP